MFVSLNMNACFTYILKIAGDREVKLPWARSARKEIIRIGYLLGFT